MNEQVNIRWYGHSCFTLEYRGYTLAVDPYADGMVPGLPPLRLSADAVYCSHAHGDHNNVGAVTLSRHSAPADFSQKEAICPHDEQGGAARGMNTVRLFRFGSLRVAHMGDVGCIPGEAVLSLVRSCDVMLLPVGGHFTVDAQTAARIVALTAPRCVVPMHYRSATAGFDVLSTVEPFTALFEDVTRLSSPSFTLTADAPRGVLLPELPR